MAEIVTALNAIEAVLELYLVLGALLIVVILLKTMKGGK